MGPPGFSPAQESVDGGVKVPAGADTRDEFIFPAASATEDADENFGMNEAEFKAFYEETAPILWRYLCRILGNAALADDLLQEVYVRTLCAPGFPRDKRTERITFFVSPRTWRAIISAPRGTHLCPCLNFQTPGRAGHDVELRSDLRKFLLSLAPRDRELLWLAYAEGYDHREIAEVLQCKTVSVRPMLFRARQRLAALLRSAGWPMKLADEEKA